MPARWSRAVCAWTLALIGSVFVLKYGARISPTAAWIAAALFPALFLAALRVVSQIATSGDHWRLSRWVAPALATTLVGFAVVEAIMSPDVSRVARAPAVADWLAALGRGDFPYCTRIRPSAFPGLFFLLAPFHLAGLSAWVPALGVVLFVVLLWHLVPSDSDRAVLLTATLLLPSLHYEGLVRSELFLNSVLAIAVIAVARRAIDRGGAAVLAAGLLAGLAASTRVIVPLALLVFVAFAFRAAPRRTAWAAAAAVLVFGALAAPFVAWAPSRFFDCGPFAVQGLYLPVAVPALSLVLAPALGWTATDLRSVYARTGFLVAALVAVGFAWKASASGVTEALWGDAFDISYFVLATPWLALGMAGRGMGNRGEWGIGNGVGNGE